MRMQEVKSSNIKAIGWEEKVMEVEFTSGARYRYLNVPRALYTRFLEAPSKGKFLHFQVKVTGRYVYGPVCAVCSGEGTAASGDDAVRFCKTCGGVGILTPGERKRA